MELCPTMLELQPQEQMASDVLPEDPCSLQALIKRLERMIFGDGERPRRSELGKATDKATAGFVAAVREAAGQLWLHREKDIKRALAPLDVDEVDVIAYLAADALGRPLLHPDDRNPLGKRVLTQATRAAAAIKAAEKLAADAVRRAKAAADADASKLPRVAAAETKGATDVAAVRNKPTPDLQLPARTVGKRIREPEPEPAPMPPPPPPPPPPPDAAFNAAVAEAVRAELARLEAVTAAAAAAGAEAAEAARAEAARATVLVARSELAAAERKLTQEQRALGRLGPKPVIGLDAVDVPEHMWLEYVKASEACGSYEEQVAWRLQWKEQVQQPYVARWWERYWEWDAQKDKVDEAEDDVASSQRALTHAEARVPRRMCAAASKQDGADGHVRA